MKKILYITSLFALIIPFSLTVSAITNTAVPITGDVAIIISAVLIVICIAAFIFVRRRRR